MWKYILRRLIQSFRAGNLYAGRIQIGFHFNIRLFGHLFIGVWTHRKTNQMDQISSRLLIRDSLTHIVSGRINIFRSFSIAEWKIGTTNNMDFKSNSLSFWGSKHLQDIKIGCLLAICLKCLVPMIFISIYYVFDKFQLLLAHKLTALI